MMKYKKISDPKAETVLFLLCWLAYFTSYIGRLNYSSAMVYMIKENLLTASGAGKVSMVYFFAYGTGQLFNGILSDRFRPGKMIFIGLFAASGANLIMGFSSLPALMAIIWGLNGYAQAMIWPPIIRLFAEMLNEDKKLKYCINIVTSQVAGTLASYLFAAISIQFLGWRSVFVTAAGCLCAMAFLWKKGFRWVERYATNSESVQGGGASMSGVEKERGGTVNKKNSLIAFFIASGLIPVLLPDMVHGVLKDGMASWVPTYISEIFEVSPVISILAAMILPIITMTGAYLAKYVYKLCREKELTAASYFFLAAFFCLIGLKVTGDSSMAVSVIMFACITAFMMAINTIFINIIPLKFEKQGKVSTVSGILNAAAYIGSALSMYGIGLIAEHLGWNAAIGTWLALTALAFVVCIIYRRRSFMEIQ